ncbi:MAG: aminotransferase class V-fold PLP-dependent enzyme, partial [Zoogloea sp.]|nr:aminotransferase class V-fold PLP-dependent enzyme [Zoogloea sp.]
AVAAAPDIARLRDRLEAGIAALFPAVRVFGADAPRLPNTSCLAIGNLDADAVLIRLDRAGVCAAMGSACSTGGHEPSHVLLAMGVPPDAARCALRFSLSHQTTVAEIEQVLELLPDALRPLMAVAA